MVSRRHNILQVVFVIAARRYNATAQQQQSQIKPTIEIKSGSRIFLVPTNHMWFAKPKNGEVMMQYFND